MFNLNISTAISAIKKIILLPLGKYVEVSRFLLMFLKTEYNVVLFFIS